MNLIKYKGYIGTVEYSSEDKVLFGKIAYINDLVTFEATTVKDLEKSYWKSFWINLLEKTSPSMNWRLC